MSTHTCAGRARVDIELVTSYIGGVAKESWLPELGVTSYFVTKLHNILPSK